MDRSNWFSIYVMLWHLICVGSSPVSNLVYTSSKVGLPAVLPCSIMSHEDSESHTPHIQWVTVSDSVFERMGQELFQGEAYRERADVPEEMLVKGNCSLFLRDVRFSDAGIYESYLVAGETEIKHRILLQSVRLVVIDHKFIRSVQRGSDLILDLYTPQAEQVIFQSGSDTNWIVLWERGDDMKRTGHLKEKDNRLIFRRASARSAGTYKVLDSDGLAISTVKVTVTEPVLSTETAIQQKYSAFGKATMNTPCVSFITLFLVIHLMF